MRIKKAHTAIVEGDLTPMIDMTFQLIAFFMVLINFTETEQDERVKLPASELAKPGPVLESPIYLNMTRSGDVIYGGQLVPLNGLRPYLLNEVAELDKKNKSPADATIIIRAHADAATGMVQQLIQVCQEARFEKFALRAKEELVP
jgi:biopolymer transport protein ExbD